MASPIDLFSLAGRIRDARIGVHQIRPFTSEIDGFDLEAAYAIANVNHEERLAAGDQVAGRKIGFTNAAMWREYGVSAPIWGYMYESTVAHTVAVPRCAIADFTEPKIEPEIVFHFASAPPVDADEAAILSCVDWIAQGFEIVQSHYPGWRFEAADTVADGALHASMRIGRPVAVDTLGDDIIDALAAFRLTLYCDDRLCDEGWGANALGHPLTAIRYLLEEIARRSHAIPLGAGEIVATGTLTPAYPIEVGQTWRTETEGIGVPGLSVALIA